MCLAITPLLSTFVYPFLSDYKGAVKKLPVIKQNHGIHLRALTDFTDDNGVARPAGAEWQLRGPLTYIPRPEVVSILVNTIM